MKLRLLFANLNLQVVVTLSGCLGIFATQPGFAGEISNFQIPQLSEIKLPDTSARMLVQTPNPSVQGSFIPITSVKANPTDKGVEVILQTTQADQLQVANRSVGNNFIADITGAQLRLSNGDSYVFRSDKLIAGITEITVTNVDANTVRVTVIGEASLPTVELFDDNAGLVFAAAPATTATQPPQAEEKPTNKIPQEKPAAQQDDPIELVVTGQQDGYRVPNASVGTRTDTPLRDIPQSIQVVPQQVIKDQQADTLNEVVKNVPGVVRSSSSPRTPNVSGFFKVRGFDSLEGILSNGLSDPTIGNIGFGTNIERIEVLKGPASVLFGQGGLGGKINLVTKQPLSEPFYGLEASAGNFNFFSGAIDLSSPLNPEKTVLYRLNASATTTEGFVDFYEQQRYQIAPVLTWLISDKTKLTLEGSYTRIDGSFDFGIPAVGSVLPNPNGKIPRNRQISEPNLNESQNEAFRIGYDFEHSFSDNWQLRSAFRSSFLRLFRDNVGPDGLLDDLRTLDRYAEDQNYDQNVYNLDNYVIGKFSTGSIQHQLVAGLNLLKYDVTSNAAFTDEIAPLDIFNPTYGASPTAPYDRYIDFKTTVQQVGFYIQDQISLAENFKVLLGGRFDIANLNYEDFLTTTTDFKQTEAFSPRIGIVYQPLKTISLYASYSSSFNQAVSVFGAASPEPERGKQYEVGIKADITDRLAATLAFYDLTRSNLPTADPNNSRLTIQVGEQNSQGIEFDMSGEILPGWNIITGYAYTDARITKDNRLTVGNLINNVPQHTFNLWTTYEIQSGNFKGLGFGLGAFYFGERKGDLANSFELPSYLRTDAAIFYKRDNFRAAINIRNLFDVDYFASALNRNRVFTGDPLTVVGTISWQF